MIRQIQQALLSQFQHDERESERLWYGHMRDMNPDAMRKAHKQWLIDRAWDVAALIALVTFVGWLVTLRA